MGRGAVDAVNTVSVETSVEGLTRSPTRHLSRKETHDTFYVSADTGLLERTREKIYLHVITLRQEYTEIL